MRRALRLALVGAALVSAFAAGTATIAGLGLGFLALGSDPFFWSAVALAVLALPALLLAAAFGSLSLRAPRPRS